MAKSKYPKVVQRLRWVATPDGEYALRGFVLVNFGPLPPPERISHAEAQDDHMGADDG